MHCMVASSIPCKLSLCADRAHACAGDSYVSSGIDVACPTSQSVFAIASPHELQGDSWPSSSTGTSSFCCNQQYSVTAITTAAGAIAERYAYTAYGLPTILDASASVLSSSAISNRYTYTGREWDATLALHHFRARWMSPIAGRFLGRDPIGYEGSEWSLNEFVQGMSLIGLDPLGLTLVSQCQDQCAKLYPHWWQYHLFVGCIVGCDPGDVIDQGIDNADTVVSVTFIVFDVITIPSGEGAVGCAASKAVARTVKQYVRQNGKKKAKEVLECEFIYNYYKGAGWGAVDCLGTTTCEDAVAKSAAKATEVAMRSRYLDKRCDYILPGSIASGSARQEANHRIELANAINRLAKCSAHAAAICAKKCCPPQNP